MGASVKGLTQPTRELAPLPPPRPRLSPGRGLQRELKPYRKDFLSAPLIRSHEDGGQNWVLLGHMTRLLVVRVTSSKGLQKVQDTSLIVLFPPSPWSPEERDLCCRYRETD